MKLLTLLLLLSALSSLALMEVVDSFIKMCPQFFIEKQIPTAPIWGHQKKICQRWKNKYRYATLYDINLRIPVYSAYKFTGTKAKTGDDKWKNEPQLETIARDNKEMEWITDETKLQKLMNQAIDNDYKVSSIYTRGHVFPKRYATDPDQSDSTFTFTNVAPQTETSNGNWAKQVETPMLTLINQSCSPTDKNPAYIVTGVIPSKDIWKRGIDIKRDNEIIKEGINIPTHYWTAFCCTNAKGKKFSKGYIAQQNEPENRTAESLTVNELNKKLSDLYTTKDYRVFGETC